MHSQKRAENSGFTLIELSIVLVIIGLLVGGVLVGATLIKGAEVRAQVTQIERFNTAVNTFRGKFGALPGDMSMSTASMFGFTPGASCGASGFWGVRDGDGVISSTYANTNAAQISGQSMGETALFWQDLSSAAAGGLIDGHFPSSGGAAIACSPAIDLNTTAGSTYIGAYLPEAKIGHGNFVAVSNTSSTVTQPYSNGMSGNWFTVMQITSITSANVIGGGTIPVIQAYSMDKKVDDGLAGTGVVEAFGINVAIPNIYNPAPSDTTTSCLNGITGVYSISSYANYGANGNCPISFRFH